MAATTPDRDGAHDFDFHVGRWRIRNERLVKRLQGRHGMGEPDDGRTWEKNWIMILTRVE